VTAAGKALDGGFATFDFNRSFKPVAEISHPDYIINRMDPSIENLERTWLIGDISLSGNTLYDKYVSPGNQQTQWNAITNHAERFGLRISVFFTFYEGNSGVASALKSKFTKEALKEGTFAFIISLKD
jgi:hypothetical protein